MKQLDTDPLLDTATNPPMDIQERVLRTLRLFADWGHAATVESLSENLLGGPVDPSLLRVWLRNIPGVARWDGVVGLEGMEDMLRKTERRARAHLQLEEDHLDLAHNFAQELLRWCPYVKCVALTGSLASGGFQEGDDIDFNLIVESETKYLSYLMGTFLGLVFAWRHRKREVRPEHSTPFLPKLMCINVVWREDETAPFSRRDASMAYELLRSRPLYGESVFKSIVDGNAWLTDYFPQIPKDSQVEGTIPQEPNPVGRLLQRMGRFPRLLHFAEQLSRRLGWTIYRFVQWTRRNNPRARQHWKFMQRVKYPYEVFQD